MKTRAFTGFPVLLIFSVESMHSLQQLPLLAAARVIDKVPGENLFQLADREVLYRLFVVEIRQRGPDPPLCRRADLQSTRGSELLSPTQREDCTQFSFSDKRSFSSADAGRKRPAHLQDAFSGLQVQEGRCWSIIMLLREKKPDLSCVKLWK